MIMVVNLIKTIIMFAMEDLPNDTQTIRNLEYEVEEGATLEQVVANQVSELSSHLSMRSSYKRQMRSKVGYCISTPSMILSIYRLYKSKASNCF